MKLHRKKCRNCHEWFVPDPRNAWHQVYCSDPECRRASRAASQRKWRRKNPDYFRGREHRERVADWRARHPFYWRQTPVSAAPPKDVFPPQPTARQPAAISATPPFPPKAPPLQDLVMSDHL